MTNKTYTTNKSNKTNKTYRTYFVLFVLLTMFFPLAPQTAHAAVTLQRPPNNLGLVGYWTMDGNDISGSNLADHSGNGNTGTIYSAAKTIGKIGQALKFDGSSQDIQVLNKNYFTQAPFTASIWVKTDTLPTNKGDGTVQNSMLSQNNGSGPIWQSWALFEADSTWGSDVQNKFVLDVIDTGGTAHFIWSDSVPTVGLWYHIVITLDSSYNEKMYVNGIQQAMTANSGSMFLSNNVLLFSNRWCCGMPGSFDDARFYNRALSATDVTKLYQSGSVKIGVSKGNLFNENFETGNLSGWTLGGSAALDTSVVAHGTHSLKLTSQSDTATKALISNIPVGSTFYYRIYIYRPTATAEMNLSLIKYANGDRLLMTDVYSYGSAYFKLRSAADLSISPETYPFNEWVRVEIKINYQTSSTGTEEWRLYHGDSTTPFHTSSATGVVTSPNNAPQTAIEFAESYSNQTIYIDDVAVSNTGWIGSVAPVKINSSQNSKLTNGLVGLWSFDGADISGVTAYDRSGAGNNGTIYNGAAPTIGKVGQALIFDSDGAGDKFVSAGAIVAHTNLSLAAWVNPSSYGGEMQTIILGSGAYYLSLNNDGSLNGYWYGTSPEGYHSSGAGTVPLNQWSHVVAVWDGSYVKLYINGVQKNAVQVTGAGNSATATILGAENTSRQFKGKIDEVRVYNRALSADEAKQLYNLGK